MISRMRAIESQRIGAELAQKLRTKRLELGLTVDDLAQRAEIGRAMIVRYERGEGGGAGLAAVSLLAQALDVSPSWLCFGEPSSKPRSKPHNK
jgi:transcriptional regulator with XRE-family HTH domain